MRLVEVARALIVIALLVGGGAQAAEPKYGKVETFEPGKKYTCVPTADRKGWNCIEISPGSAPNDTRSGNAPMAETTPPAPPAAARTPESIPATPSHAPAAPSRPKGGALPAYLRASGAPEQPTAVPPSESPTPAAPTAVMPAPEQAAPATSAPAVKAAAAPKVAEPPAAPKQPSADATPSRSTFSDVAPAASPAATPTPSASSPAAPSQQTGAPPPSPAPAPEPARPEPTAVVTPPAPAAPAQSAPTTPQPAAPAAPAAAPAQAAQMPEPAPAPEEPAAPSPEPAPAMPPTAAATESKPPPPAHPAPSGVRGNREFLSLAGSDYVIELAHSANPSEFAALRDSLQLPHGELYELHLRRDNGDWWLLVWASFDGVDAARAARAELPADAAINAGWPRRIGVLQAEARRVSSNQD